MQKEKKEGKKEKKRLSEVKRDGETTLWMLEDHTAMRFQIAFNPKYGVDPLLHGQYFVDNLG